MKKKYTRKQITEAIAYWEKQLELNEYIHPIPGDPDYEEWCRKHPGYREWQRHYDSLPWSAHSDSKRHDYTPYATKQYINKSNNKNSIEYDSQKDIITISINGKSISFKATVVEFKD